MNNLETAAGSSNREHFAFTSGHGLFHAMLLLCLMIASCKKETADEAPPPESGAPDLSTEAHAVHTHQYLSWQTIWELLQARAATAKYRNINKAIADGYTDIDVVVPNMGHHYMKSSLVDAHFDPRKPEILVYNKKANGHFELVAVEYAVPLNLSQQAPQGFTGSADVWDHNTTFGLWLLHAWVWHYNPDGIFNPTNSLVHLH